MKQRFFAFGAIAVVVVCLEAVSVGGQGPAVANAKNGTSPRTTWGDPDLQGMWNNPTGTPLERADPNAPKRVWTEDERTAIEGTTGTYNSFWSDGQRRSTRPSMVLDPTDGRIPPLTPFAQAREAARLQARRGRGDADSWEDRHRWERCITLGLPIVPTPYNSNFQVLQTPGYVVILLELIHEARIIPLDGRPHVRQGIRQWLGDSRGRWEGETLVVDTTNFNDKLDGGTFMPARQGQFQHMSVHRGSGDTLKLTERFTRVSAETMNYEFTIDDPKTFTRPWTALIPVYSTQDHIFEYACHEGNYGLRGILAGGRAKDGAAR